MAKVLVGEVAMGDSDMVRPPPLQTAAGVERKYDSTVDCPYSPRIIVSASFWVLRVDAGCSGVQKCFCASFSLGGYLANCWSCPLGLTRRGSLLTKLKVAHVQGSGMVLIVCHTITMNRRVLAAIVWGCVCLTCYHAHLRWGTVGHSSGHRAREF